MKDFKERLKSPVIWFQFISLIAAAVVLLWPDLAETVKIVVGTLVAAYNLFAGYNNPTDRDYV